MRQVYRRIATTAALLTLLSTNLYAAPRGDRFDSFLERLLRKLTRVVSVLNDGTLSIPPG